MLEKFYDGSWDMNKLISEVYFLNANELMDSYKKGYNKEFFGVDWTVEDTELVNRIQNNVFAFSGAKSYAMMNELKNAVYKDGKLLSEGEFRRAAKKINKDYNESYLNAERHHVMAAGTNGSRWVDMQESKETHPFLEYMTARDDRVRDGHARLDGIILPIDDPFWENYYPPNGWRCRCFVRKLTARDARHKTNDYNRKNPNSPMPDSDLAQKTAGSQIAKPFRRNVGTTVIFDKDGHPYFKHHPDGKSYQLSAVKHYGLKKTNEIYSGGNLAKYKGSIDSEEKYISHWNSLEKKYGKKDSEGFTLIDKENNISAHFDNKLKEKMKNRSRHTYFDEVENVFFKPDEVWSNYKGGGRFKTELFNIYIKYYEDAPIVLFVDQQGETNSFYRLEDDIPDKLEAMRHGVLINKKDD